MAINILCIVEYICFSLPNLLLFPSSYPDVGRQISDHQSNRGRGDQGQETGGKVWRLG